ncbi:hypothetical protein D3P08_24795 [Paenibacillus nanensis]|uniref:Uncharacterized protein n=1 Tax=Paenibacillus nanensis TaxID=393251 RepID=A0A3A1UP72_9BACL|nr:hypothetical protein [Paenibacillus nanensis]RIX47898.1 hypothetical protein D3P08_24795 [Paenibacillus nanensis]
MRTYKTNLFFFIVLVVLGVISYVMERSEVNELQAEAQMMSLLAVQEYEPFYSLAATQAERQALNKLESDTSLGPGVWTREALVTVGLLPADQSRLTLEDAEAIVGQTLEPDKIIERFNDIAGAPDWQGGSGTDLKIYYLDDERRDAITVLNRMTVSYVSYDESGEKSVQLTKE